MNAFKTVPFAMAAMLVAGAALAQPTTQPTTQPAAPTAPTTHSGSSQKAAPAATTVSGKVDALFGRQIVIAADDGSKLLVDLGRHAPLQPALTVGEAVKVTGQMERNQHFGAHQLTRADGTSVELQGGRHAEGKHHWHHQHAAAAPSGSAPTTGTN